MYMMMIDVMNTTIIVSVILQSIKLTDNDSGIIDQGSN
jgi:hypothetical protein